MTVPSGGNAEEIRERGLVAVYASRAAGWFRERRARASWRLFGLEAAFIALLGAGLGYTGPFGTFALPLAVRMPYWTLKILLTALLWQLLRLAISQLIPERRGYTFMRAALIAPPFCALGSLFTLTSVSLLFGAWPMGSVLAQWPAAFLEWMALTLGVIAPLLFIANALARERREQWGEGLFGFLMQRLPPPLRGAELLALKAEDHYVRVYTSAGDDLVLMRFEDALAALEGYPGVQTHRSWWAAAGAVRSIEPQAGGLAEVVLTSGLRVPVSRRRKAALSALEARRAA